MMTIHKVVLMARGLFNISAEHNPALVENQQGHREGRVSHRTPVFSDTERQAITTVLWDLHRTDKIYPTPPPKKISFHSLSEGWGGGGRAAVEKQVISTAAGEQKAT